MQSKIEKVGLTGSDGSSLILARVYAGSQDPLHLVPKGTSVGPELSSTISKDNFGIGSTFLPSFRASRKRTLVSVVVSLLMDFGAG
jgi:hypothetical protein